MFFKSKKKSGTVSKISPNYIPSESFKRSTRKKQRIFLKKVNSSSRFGKLKTYSIFSIIIGIIGFLIYFFVFSNFFLIKNIQVIYTGDEIDPNSGSIEKDLDIFKNKNLLILDKQKIVDKILGNYIDISELTIRKEFPDKIVIKFNKYPIIANIINEVSEQIEEKFLVNKTGMIIKKDDENPNLPYIRDFSQESFSPNTIIIEEKKLDYILKAIQLYEDRFGMKIIEAKYYPIEREVHLETEKNFDIWIDMTKDLEAQLKKLKNALTELDIYNEALEYIDLRIFSASGDRIDFKRRNQ